MTGYGPRLGNGRRGPAKLAELDYSGIENPAPRFLRVVAHVGPGANERLVGISAGLLGVAFAFVRLILIFFAGAFAFLGLGFCVVAICWGG